MVTHTYIYCFSLSQYPLVPAHFFRTHKYHTIESQAIGSSGYRYSGGWSESRLTVSESQFAAHAIGVELAEVDVVVVLPQPSLNLAHLALHLMAQFTPHLLKNLQPSSQVNVKVA